MKAGKLRDVAVIVAPFVEGTRYEVLAGYILVVHLQDMNICERYWLAGVCFGIEASSKRFRSLIDP